MLYDVFYFDLAGSPLKGFDRCIPLGAADLTARTIALARCINGDGHVLWGYDGAWHVAAPKVFRDRWAAEEEAAAERARQMDAQAAAAATVRVSAERAYLKGQERWVLVGSKTMRLAARDCVAAASQDDPALAAIYRHVARECGWL